MAPPATATNPTPAEMVKGMSRSQSATTPPSAANGAPVKMMRVSRIEWVLA